MAERDERVGDGFDEAGRAADVPAGAQHGFGAYEEMSVLVIFERRQT